MKALALRCHDIHATAAVAEHVSRWLKPGDQLWLSGPLGAGKTTLVRHILRALGHSGHVKSPSYSLVETYTLGAMQVAHMDLFRLQNQAQQPVPEFLLEYVEPPWLSLIEWPQSWLPPPQWRIELDFLDPAGARSLCLFGAWSEAQAEDLGQR